MRHDHLVRLIDSQRMLVLASLEPVRLTEVHRRHGSVYAARPSDEG